MADDEQGAVVGAETDLDRGDGVEHRQLLGGLLPEGEGGSQSEPLRARPPALAAADVLPSAVIARS